MCCQNVLMMMIIQEDIKSNEISFSLIKEVYEYAHTHTHTHTPSHS